MLSSCRLLVLVDKHSMHRVSFACLHMLSNGLINPPAGNAFVIRPSSKHSHSVFTIGHSMLMTLQLIVISTSRATDLGSIQ